MKIIESQLRKIIREELITVLENAPEIKDLKTKPEIEMCEYDLSVEGVKVFLTLPSYSTGRQQFKNSALIQGRDIIRNLVKGSLSTASVQHVGFIFSDKTTLESVVFNQNDESITPENSIILLIKNTSKQHEDIIRKRGEEIISFHENMGNEGDGRYNFAGIIHKIPFIGKILKNVVPRKLNTYYCSEFVADLLASAGIITVQELKAAQSLSENKNEIYDNSALSPSELYDLIKDKAEVLKTNCL